MLSQSQPSSVDDEKRRLYIEFTKRFRGLEFAREFVDHVQRCPKCWQLFVDIVAHMSSVRNKPE